MPVVMVRCVPSGRSRRPIDSRVPTAHLARKAKRAPVGRKARPHVGPDEARRSLDRFALGPPVRAMRHGVDVYQSGLTQVVSTAIVGDAEHGGDAPDVRIEGVAVDHPVLPPFIGTPQRLVLPVRSLTNST